MIQQGQVFKLKASAPTVSRCGLTATGMRSRLRETAGRRVYSRAEAQRALQKSSSFSDPGAVRRTCCSASW